MPSHKILETMVHYSSQYDTIRLKLALEYLKPVTLELEEKQKKNFEANIKIAINNNDKKELEFRIRQLQFYNLIDIMEGIIIELESSEFKTSEARVWQQFAYLNFSLLSSDILATKDGFYLNRDIKNLFRKLSSLLTISHIYHDQDQDQDQVKINMIKYRMWTKEISKKIVIALPSIQDETSHDKSFDTQ
ncbi:MAG: hypothetical protein JKX76_03990 [Colwellia sp.]|nr:hypothetical protein [Colwellia sp.]